MSFDKLSEELASDPLGRGYSSLTDSAIVDDLNSVYREKNVVITSAELLAWSASSGRLASLKAAISGGIDDNAKSLAEAAYLMITRDETSLDLSLSDRVQMLDGLVAYGILTAGDKAELVAKSTEPCSRAEELGLGRVRTGTVSRARNN
jgi:hypothetical protein